MASGVLPTWIQTSKTFVLTAALACRLYLGSLLQKWEEAAVFETRKPYLFECLKYLWSQVFGAAQGGHMCRTNSGSFFTRPLSVVTPGGAVVDSLDVPEFCSVFQRETVAAHGAQGLAGH